MSRNTSYAAICEHCYLSKCVYELYEEPKLEMYCAEYQARKRKIKPDVMLAIVKTIGKNRKWDFMKGVKNATVDAE